MTLTELQTRLAVLQFYFGKIDGAYGPLTSTAISALFQQQHVEAKWQAWPAKRRVLAAQQLICRIDGIDPGKIDGLFGPQTQHAFTVYAARKIGDTAVETWRDHESPVAGGSTVWPRQNAAEMNKFYGPVGANQKQLILPYPMRIAWDKDKIIHKISINARCSESAAHALKRAFDHYGFEKIKELGLDLFGGCLNVRKMRGGSAWSVHAWGAAIDFDPERNQLKWGKNRAEMGKPAYAPWFEIWEAEGWVSLGRVKDYDWMHIQAARL